MIFIERAGMRGGGGVYSYRSAAGTSMGVSLVTPPFGVCPVPGAYEQAYRRGRPARPDLQGGWGSFQAKAKA